MKTMSKIALAAALVAAMAVISGCSSCGTSSCYAGYDSSETVEYVGVARPAAFADGSTYVTAE